MNSNLDTAVIDAAIESYVCERRKMAGSIAANRFMVRTLLRYRDADAERFLKAVVATTGTYISLSRFLQKFSWQGILSYILALAALACGSFVSARYCGVPAIGIMVGSACLLAIRYLLARAADSWCDESVRVAIYDELREVARKGLS